MYDVVIIGAGPSGLAAAARLAYFEAKVCLIEAHNRLGGMNSWHHVKGHEVSSGLHAFTNYGDGGNSGPLGKLLRQLRLKHSELKLQPQLSSSIRFPSATLRFSNDTELIRQQIALRFPDQSDGFDRFRQLVRDTDEGELTPRQASAREVMERFIGDPLLVDMLFCPVMFYGNPGGVGDGQDAERTRPDMDWLLFCVLWKCIFETGLGHPAGGIRPLWEALAARIRKDGGDIRLSTRVERFRVRDGKVRAAVLANGEEVEGELFLSSAGGVETDCLVDPDALPAKPAGTITIVEGICLPDAKPADAGLAETAIFYSFEDRLDFRRPDGLVQQNSGVVCASGNYLSADADDLGVVKVSQLANYAAWRSLNREEYASAKGVAATGMAAVLAKLEIAGLKKPGYHGKYGLFDDLFTPLTLQRYTSHVDGALYGSPVKSRTGATSCENLFLIGADQGFHGIVGAMLSGVAMANMHWLKKHT